MPVKEKALRAAIVAQCRALNASGLNQGTAGNISARLGEALVITPTAIPYDVLRPQMLALMPLNGEYGAWSGPAEAVERMALPPRHHARAARRRRDRPLPPALRHGAGDAGQADPGGPLRDRAVRRPGHRVREIRALRHQGIVGPRDRGPRRPPWRAARQPRRDRHRRQPRKRDASARAELEVLARMYYLAIAAGRPTILSDEEIARVVERFKSYGGGIDAQRRSPPTKKRARGKAAAKRGPKKKSARKKTGRAVARQCRQARAA